MTPALRLVHENDNTVAADTLPPLRVQWGLVAAGVLCLAWLGVWVVGAVAIVSLFL